MAFGTSTATQVETSHVVSQRADTSGQAGYSPGQQNVVNLTEWVTSRGTDRDAERRKSLTATTASKPIDRETVYVSTASLSLPKLDSKAYRIIRAYFAKTILSDLTKIQTYAGQPTAAVYANNLQRTIRQFRDKSPYEPFVEVLMAFHDAITFENKWSEYTAGQYEGALKVLKSYANQDLDNSKVLKAIAKLEVLGFDTVPFGAEFELPVDEEAVDVEEASQQTRHEALP
jgi:hypothetical protein